MYIVYIHNDDLVIPSGYCRTLNIVKLYSKNIFIIIYISIIYFYILFIDSIILILNSIIYNR